MTKEFKKLERGTAAIAIAIGCAVAAAPASAETATWSDTAPITFPNTESPFFGAPYPASITVSGQEGPITDVNLNLNLITLPDLWGLQLLLVSPSGESEVVIRDACTDVGATSLNWTIDQGGVVGGCQSGSRRPSDNCGPACTGLNDFSGAPAGDRTANFDNFNGENANGNWLLYAYRECAPQLSHECTAADQIGGGFSLRIETGPFDTDLSASGTSGPGTPYPATRTVSGETGLITDLNVRVREIFHNHPDDIELLLEKAGGPAVMLMSDACGRFDLEARNWLWDDEAPAQMTDEGTTPVCFTANGLHRPTNHQPGDSLPAPAPQAPYATGLSAFDLTDPNGEWRLWAADDSVSGEGFITEPFTLEYQTRPRATTAFTVAAAEVAEGGQGTLVVRRSGVAAPVAATVTVTSAPDSAGPGDFTPIAETLSFAPDQVERTIVVGALDDAEGEGAEAFTVSLSAATGDAALGAPATATVTIPANAGDPPPPPPPTPLPDEPPPPPPSPLPEIDLLAPETSIVSGPAPVTPKRRAKIAFTSSEPESSFECKLGRAAFAPCTSPVRLKRLDERRHRFRVRAADAAGNIDPTAAKLRWKVRRSAE